MLLYFPMFIYLCFICYFDNSDYNQIDLQSPIWGNLKKSLSELEGKDCGFLNTLPRNQGLFPYETETYSSKRFPRGVITGRFGEKFSLIHSFSYTIPLCESTVFEKSVSKADVTRQIFVASQMKMMRTWWAIRLEGGINIFR